MKIIATFLALGLAGAAGAQDGPFTRVYALPASSCFANTPADEPLLRRSMDGLRNVSATRTVWVTCSIPTPQVMGAYTPNDEIRIGFVEMLFTTTLPSATLPCKVHVNIRSSTGFGDPTWGQTSVTQGNVGRVSIAPITQGRWTADTFAMQCKIPQATTLLKFGVLIRQVDFIPIE